MQLQFSEQGIVEGDTEGKVDGEGITEGEVLGTTEGDALGEGEPEACLNSISVSHMIEA